MKYEYLKDKKPFFYSTAKFFVRIFASYKIEEGLKSELSVMNDQINYLEDLLIAKEQSSPLVTEHQITAEVNTIINRRDKQAKYMAELLNSFK